MFGINKKLEGELKDLRGLVGLLSARIQRVEGQIDGYKIPIHFDCEPSLGLQKRVEVLEMDGEAVKDFLDINVYITKQEPVAIKRPKGKSRKGINEEYQ